MPSSTRPLVVVADPDVRYAALMARELRLAGYETVTTDNSMDTSKLVDERRPDALVLEVAVRGRTGYTLCRELRDQPQNRLMPIVMISPRAGKLDRDFAFTCGADRYVKKPFAPVDIVARLSELVPVEAPQPVRVRRRRAYVPVPEPILI